ncbi:helix-turn-helix domain-containing protein [Natronorubrum sp. JWXQ-INN-674]|uniref:Helix-turn-helix domain-containing protein n=1 Tax=Natronorubrum halalkaliphilum TaxID=2691917 RepID=A0A6B0VJ92_9EURY|nr:helix-turn-helix domain-containing protein [Natronorubrum halalkaliphilum]MXV61323.1 helix-turn-helix domain-containing protein [Natronorubrum halalkaliphilum]
MSRSNASSDGESPLECTDCLDPADAFALVSNETRLSILEALWAADDRPVSFSELRREVGMRDSAQFNYHLQQLTDHFVTQVEDGSASGGSSGGRSGGGYDFKHAGEKVVRSVIAGSFNEHPTIEPFPVEGACVACDGPVEARYRDEQLAIACADCGHGHGEYDFPPGGLNDRTREEVADAFDQRVKHLHCLAADGVCPECSGRVESRVVEDDACCLGATVRVDHECVQCGHTLCSAPGLRLLDHSRVVSFHRERGVSLDERPYWTLPWCVSDEYTTLVDRDPTRLRVRIPLEGDELRATLNGGLDVLETTVQSVD